CVCATMTCHVAPHCEFWRWVCQVYNSPILRLLYPTTDGESSQYGYGKYLSENPAAMILIQILRHKLIDRLCAYVRIKCRRTSSEEKNGIATSPVMINLTPRLRPPRKAARM